MDEFQLKYEFRSKFESETAEEAERKSKLSQAVWGALGGASSTHRRISKKQAIEEGRIEA